VVQSEIGVARMVRDESIVSRVSVRSHRRRRDDVFTCHVSDAGPNRSDRESTRLNSSHFGITYAVFRLHNQYHDKTIHVSIRTTTII